MTEEEIRIAIQDAINEFRQNLLTNLEHMAQGDIQGDQSNIQIRGLHQVIREA